MKNIIFIVIISLITSLVACITEPNTTTTIDATLPVLTVESPTNGQVTALVYAITGTVSDAGSGIAGVSVTVDSGAAVAAVVANGLWSATVEVSSTGPHTNSVSAVDNNGNWSVAVQVITMADNIPSVIITSPASGIITNVQSVRFTGTASITEPYEVILVQVSLNGSSWMDAEDTELWNSQISLNHGFNTIYARAIASNGKINISAPLHIIYRLTTSDIIFVSASTGNNTNDGFYPATPLSNLNTAVQRAISYKSSFIFVSGNYLLTTNTTSSNAGWYIKGATNLTICGGWNEEFTAQGSASILNGQTKCKHAVYLHKCSGLTLSNFILTGGASTNAYGGGLAMYSTANSAIACIVSNNSAKYGGGVYSSGNFNQFFGFVSNNTSIYDGAGLYLSGNQNVINGYLIANRIITDHYRGGGIYLNGLNNIISGIIFKNSSFYGGGIYIIGNYNSISGIILNNSTSGYGGGIYIESGKSNTVSGIVSGNTSGQGGGVYIFMSSSYNTLSGTVANNTAGNGGGIYLYGSYNTISGTVSGNTAGSGGGICLYTSHYNTISGTVSGNTANDGGGITIDGNYNTVTGTVSGNSATNNGGGIYISTIVSRYNIISGIVSNNTASQNGGGVYFVSCNSNTFVSPCVVRYNHCGSGFTGGGIYVTGGSGNTIQSGCVWSPNFKGSGTTVTNDLYGITAP